MVSSVREKMIKVEKAKKLATRAAETGVVLEKVELVRARDNRGHFISDDPETPEDEAWVEKPKNKEAKKTASKKRGRPRKKV
jgi:hypothetical protein